MYLFISKSGYLFGFDEQYVKAKAKCLGAGDLYIVRDVSEALEMIQAYPKESGTLPVDHIQANAVVFYDQFSTRIVLDLATNITYFFKYTGEGRFVDRNSKQEISYNYKPETLQLQQSPEAKELLDRFGYVLLYDFSQEMTVKAFPDGSLLGEKEETAEAARRWREEHPQRPVVELVRVPPARYEE